MASLIDLRRRIRSVKNTQQITKAMKMVASSKLRRAQQRVLGSRPYARLLGELTAGVLAAIPEDSPVLSHPLLEQREEKRILLIVLGGEKGLCGAFNTNVIKAVEQFLAARAGNRVELELIGRKMRDYYVRRPHPISGEWPGVLAAVEFSAARELAAKVIKRYADREIDAAYLLFNEFKSVLQQRVALESLLPILPPKADRRVGADYIYEQPPDRIFENLLPRYVETGIYQAMLESVAAEHAARMTAMDAASSNAEEVIEKLTLTLNRARQASITTEIIEIVSGAAALS